MAFIGLRLPDNIKKEIETKARLSGVTITDYILNLIYYDMKDVIYNENDNWLLSSAYNFDLTTQQIRHAISSGGTAGEVIMQIGRKSKKFKTQVEYIEDEIYVQAESTGENEELIAVKTSKDQSKINAVKDLLTKIDKKLTEVV
jgi:uncharacterized protein (DUF1778 family)